MSREELVQRIRQTFPDDPFQDKSDQDEGDLDRRYFYEHYCGKRWHELTPDELEFLAMDAWVFQSEELSYFLPAFMTTDLRDDSWTLERMPHYLSEPEIYQSWNQEQLLLMQQTLHCLYEGAEEFERVFSTLKERMR